MTNLEKYDQQFIRNLRVTKEELPGLQYKRTRYWDSVGHMDLISGLEEAFGINFTTLDMLDLSTYEKGKEILKQYGIDL